MSGTGSGTRGGASRGVSTALDACVFLVLVTAAVGTLAFAGPSPSTAADGTAAATARTLTAGTVAVEYGPVGGRNRTARGTAAELLAASALADARVDGRRLTPTGTAFAEAARAAVAPVARHRSATVQVRVVWVAYDGAPLRASATVGADPPAGRNVDAAAVTVPSGLPSARERALDAARHDGFAGVARVVAGSVVHGLFPPDATRTALYGEGSWSDVTAARYRGTARTLDASLDGTVGGAATDRANRRLRRALADRLARDLRERFDAPEVAARAVAVGEVRVVVRTWSP